MLSENDVKKKVIIITLNGQNTQVGGDLFPFRRAHPQLPFSHLTNDGVADIDEDDDDTKANRPVQMKRTDCGSG
jgi:hypothetical protein